jgi:hypothetical protein
VHVLARILSGSSPETVSTRELDEPAAHSKHSLHVRTVATSFLNVNSGRDTSPPPAVYTIRMLYFASISHTFNLQTSTPLPETKPTLEHHTQHSSSQHSSPTGLVTSTFASRIVNVACSQSTSSYTPYCPPCSSLASFSPRWPSPHLQSRTLQT